MRDGNGEGHGARGAQCLGCVSGAPNQLCRRPKTLLDAVVSTPISSLCMNTVAMAGCQAQKDSYMHMVGKEAQAGTLPSPTPHSQGGSSGEDAP